MPSAAKCGRGRGGFHPAAPHRPAAPSAPAPRPPGGFGGPAKPGRRGGRAPYDHSLVRACDFPLSHHPETRRAGVSRPGVSKGWKRPSRFLA